VLSPGDDAVDQRDRATRVLIVAMRIEGMIFFAEPLLEPFGHSTKTSAVNVKTRVAGSLQLPGGNPALWQTAFRKASGVNPCSTATCGSRTACARPRRTSRPSRPITRRHRSDVSTSTGWSGGGKERSGSAMILLSAADRVRAIQLLVQHHARQLVGQGQRSQAPAALGTVEHIVRQAVRVANDERDVAALHFPTTDELGKLGRAPGLPVLR